MSEIPRLLILSFLSHLRILLSSVSRIFLRRYPRVANLLSTSGAAIELSLPGESFTHHVRY
jgi:hypothetical protein